MHIRYVQYILTCTAGVHVYTSVFCIEFTFRGRGHTSAMHA